MRLLEWICQNNLAKDHHNGGGVLSIFREEAISSLSLRKEASFMSVDSVISLIALFVAIITLVIRSVSLGMQIEKDTNETKKDRQSDK